MHLLNTLGINLSSANRWLCIAISSSGLRQSKTSPEFLFGGFWPRIPIPTLSPQSSYGAGSTVSSPSGIRGGAPATNAIYGSQNASRGNIFQSFMWNANDDVLIIRICCSIDSHVTSIDWFVAWKIFQTFRGRRWRELNPLTPLKYGPMTKLHKQCFQFVDSVDFGDINLVLM